MPRVTSSVRASVLGLVALTTSAVLTATASNAALPEHSSVVSTDPSDGFVELVRPTGTPKPRVESMALGHDTVFIGGVFQRVRDASGEENARSLVAVDEVTGQLKPFPVSLDGNVYALAVAGDSLYVGGDFRVVNGVRRPFLVKLDADTGAVDRAFRPGRAGVRARVNDLALANNMLFVAGTFGKRLVAVDPGTAADTGFADLGIAGEADPDASGKTSVFSIAINPQATRLVAVGNFATVDGQTRTRAFMADLSGTTATLDPWYYEPLTRPCRSRTTTRLAYLNDVDFSPSGDYFVVVATGFVVAQDSDLFVTICDAAARFETDIADPLRPTWINYTGGDTLTGVIATGSAVYVQGHHRWLDNPYGRDFAGPGAVDSRGLGAVDPVTGAALDWQSRKPAARGGKGFLSTTLGLWVGSDSRRFGDERHVGVGFLPLP